MIITYLGEWSTMIILVKSSVRGRFYSTMSYNGNMKAQLKRQLKEDPALLKEEIAVLTRDLRHYQSRLRSLQQQLHTEDAAEREMRAQCLQLMRVRRRLRSLL